MSVGECRMKNEERRIHEFAIWKRTPLPERKPRDLAPGPSLKPDDEPVDPPQKATAVEEEKELTVIVIDNKTGASKIHKANWVKMGD